MDETAPLASGARRGASPAGGARRPRWRWLVLALAVPAALFGPGLISGELFVSVLPVSAEPLRSERPDEAFVADRDAHWVTGDRLFPFLTDQLAVREELTAGRLPTWEPRLGLGLPLFAGTLVAVAYPPNWLAVLLPPERAAGALALLSLFLAGLGTALFLARLGLAPGAVACGVAAVELGGWGICNLPYFMKVDAAVWIPWSLWAVEGCLRGRRWSGFLLALSITCSFLAGFVPVAVFGLALTGAWALVRWAALRPPGAGATAAARPLLVCALFAALGLAGAGVQVLPTLETSRASARTGGGDLLPQSLPDAVLWGTLVPDLFGGPADTTPAGGSPVAWWLTDPDELSKAELANPLEWNTYALAAAVLLALVAVVATPRRALFPLLALVVVFGFALGRAPASWLYAVPGLDLGAPGRALALAWVLWPWLAALGVDALCARRPRAFGTFLGASFVLAASAFVLWSGLDPAGWARDLEELLLARYGESHDQTLATIRERLPVERSIAAAERLAGALAHTLGAGLACFAAGVLALLWTRGGPRLGAAPGLLAVALLAAAPPLSSGTVPVAALLALLLALAVGVMALTRGGALAWAPLLACLVAEGTLAQWHRTRGLEPLGIELFPPSPGIDAVRTAAGDGRVLRYDTSASGLEHVQRLARPNLLSAYAVNDLTPYLVFTPRTLFELARALDPGMLSRRHVSHLPDTALLDHPILDLMRVQAILSLEPLEHPRLTPVLERRGFCVYRRAGALPAVRIVPEALAAASDEAVLATLAAGELDLARATLVAPEHASALAGVAPAPADWKPGALERVERPARNALDVSVWGASGGWLVFHEQYADGWRARVNGVETPVLRTDHAFRAVRIPRGESRVETWYAPASLRLGALLTLLSLTLAALLSARLSGQRAEPPPPLP